jgi:predicted dinucleotide-binding enzyme
MDIGVIGAGRVGSGLAKLWIGAGHQVMLSFSRDRGELDERAEAIGATSGSPEEAAAFGEVIAFSPPLAAIREALKAAGSLDGKTLIDCTNDVEELIDGSVAEEIADIAGGVTVVKAFNTVFAALYDSIAASDPPPHMLYCGDDTEGKRMAATLIADAGFEPVDAGDLSVSADLEAMARLVIGLAYRQGYGPFFYRFEKLRT